MTLEDLDRVLTHPNITRIPQPEQVDLCRDHQFIINGQLYRIEWWTNMIYLHHGGVMVAAERVVQSGTWPNRAKLNLQFEYHLVTVAVIVLEEYPT